VLASCKHQPLSHSASEVQAAPALGVMHRKLASSQVPSRQSASSMQATQRSEAFSQRGPKDGPQSASSWQQPGINKAEQRPKRHRSSLQVSPSLQSASTSHSSSVAQAARSDRQRIIKIEFRVFTLEFLTHLFQVSQSRKQIRKSTHQYLRPCRSGHLMPRWAQTSGQKEQGPPFSYAPLAPFQMEFFELGLGDIGGSAAHEALAGGCFGEGDDVADGGRAGQEHAEAIQAQGDPAMGWCAVL